MIHPISRRDDANAIGGFGVVGTNQRKTKEWRCQMKPNS